ncbi:MAG: alanine racemase [Herminiimonas sp.]|nr:alanine racemase [Herminiimonas sp.]
MPRPLSATIHLAALQHNLTVARDHANGAKLWAVVKANGYGHGLLRAMHGFAAADGLALIEFDNALKLREAGWQQPILMLEGCFDADDVATAARHYLTCTVHCAAQIAMLEAFAASRAGGGARIDVHLKLNSGMNRLGFDTPAFRQAHARLRRLPLVGNISLMTHFANADAPETPALPLARQVACFEAACDGLAGERTLANSATDLMHSALCADWVRPGIMLYGASPGTNAAAHYGLQPAMTLSSALIGTQVLHAGDAVGYGSRFVASGPMRIGIVACGYADGYPRHAPDGTPVIVAGLRTRLVGRVAMDMLVVDLTPVPTAQVGAPVILWGRGLPVDDVAQAAGTIGYELLCAVAPRVAMVDDFSAIDAHDGLLPN